MSLKKFSYSLFLILIVAAGLRFFDLGRGDAVSDEVLYGFRAIAYLDFDFAWYQPSTLQLIAENIPGWTKLSFHDHPPLVFAVQHLFVKLFGANLWSVRFPSALFGLASVYLIYLIGLRLFSRTTGYLAAALLAVNVLMLYVSRTAMQEAQVIFFILLSVYFFLRSRENSRWLLALGLSFALGLLSKYTIAFLALPFLFYAIIYQRAWFKDKFLYLGALLTLLVFSPVIIYNILLYKNFGHFDFQFSFMFSQEVDYWQVTPGKEIGSLKDRFIGFFVNIWQYNSALFNILATSSLVFGIYKLFKKAKPSLVFLLLIIGSNLLMYLAIGPAVRFLTILIPWLALLIAWAILHLKRFKTIFAVVLGVVLAWEMFFAVNSTIVYQPKGQEGISYSKIHWDVHDWGFNSLEEYLDEVTLNRQPAFTLPFVYDFLEEIRDQALLAKQEAGATPVNLLVVYDDNIFDLAALWIFDRQTLYQGWPMVSVSVYESLVEDLKSLNQLDVLFVRPVGQTLLVPEDRRTNKAELLQQQLEEAQVDSIFVNNQSGQPAWQVYYFNEEYLR